MAAIQPFSASPPQAVFHADKAAKRQVEKATKGQGFYDHDFAVVLYIAGALFLLAALMGAIMLAFSFQGQDARFLSLDRQDFQAIAWVLAPSGLICGIVIILAGRIQQKHRTMMRADEVLWLADGCLWYAWHRPFDGDVVVGPDDVPGSRTHRSSSVNIVAIDLERTRVHLDEEGFFVFAGGIHGSYFADGVPGPLTLSSLGYDETSQEARIGDYFGVDLRRFAPTSLN